MSNLNIWTVLNIEVFKAHNFILKFRAALGCLNLHTVSPLLKPLFGHRIVSTVVLVETRRMLHLSRQYLTSRSQDRSRLLGKGFRKHVERLRD